MTKPENEPDWPTILAPYQSTTDRYEALMGMLSPSDRVAIERRSKARIKVLASRSNDL